MLVRHTRDAGRPAVRILSAAEELLGTLLNPFPGLFHIFPEAVSRVAADAAYDHEGGGET